VPVETGVHGVEVDDGRFSAERLKPHSGGHERAQLCDVVGKGRDVRLGVDLGVPVVVVAERRPAQAREEAGIGDARGKPLKFLSISLRLSLAELGRDSPMFKNYS
jgi:hypothetical protein